MYGTPNNLAAFYLNRAQEFGNRSAMLYRSGGERNWQTLSYAAWCRQAQQIGEGLTAMDVAPGDTVVMVASSSKDALVFSWAVAFAGCVLVPVHPTTPPEEFAGILDAVKARFVCLQDPALLEQYRAQVTPLFPRVAVMASECVVTDPPPGRRPLLRHDDVVPEKGRVSTLEQLASLGKNIGCDDKNYEDVAGLDMPAMIIHTAGTQGEQRGVMLSHRNLLYQARTLSFLLPVSREDTQLVFLPMTHILGVIAVLSSVAVGVQMALGSGMRSLLEDLQDVRPTYMVGVPRVFEKTVEKIDAISADFSLLWKQTYSQGVEAAKEELRARRTGQAISFRTRMTLEVARRTVFQRCRELFGGRMRFMVSGGAPLAPNVGHTIIAFGIPVLDGFGLTETSGATHMNRLESLRVGTVGLPLPMVDTRIAPDGEILVRGPGVMMGYLGAPDATREVLEDDGWLRTGDLGYVDPEGFLFITGRKKSIIVTATGKNVVPARVETGIESAVPLISHCVVAGDDRSFLVALIALNKERVMQWGADNGLEGLAFEELRADAGLYRELEQAINETCRQFPPHERVRKFALLDAEFTVDSGELTRDLKLRRVAVLQRYKDVVDLLYKERY